MKLLELNPKWAGENGERNRVIFDCPKCHSHKIGVPILSAENAWGMQGDTFVDLTLTPSILHKEFIYEDIEKDPHIGHECESHFFVRNGEIQMV